MPKSVMEELGLDITRSYHDLFSFDSRKVKCLGLIKDMAITLTQLPMKSMMMDIVVADVPPKFGMLLSRGWIKRLGGTLQNDLSYASVLVFGGESRRLYREAQLAHIVTDEKNPSNHPIYAVDTDFGARVLQIEVSQKALLQLKKPIIQADEELIDDNDEVNRFLQVIDEFSKMQIDQENEALEEDPQFQLRNKIGKDSIIQLPSNHIPKGLIPLEILFDQNDMPYKAAQNEDLSAVYKHDIGGPSQPRYVNLSTHLSTEKCSEYCNSMRQFADVFSWEYSDLKTYEKKIIPHKIPLQKDTIPFKQKLRPINPLPFL